MYAAALSLPGVPGARPSSASLARYVMSRRTSAVSVIAVRGTGATAEVWHAASAATRAARARARAERARCIRCRGEGWRARGMLRAGALLCQSEIPAPDARARADPAGGGAQPRAQI